MTITAYPFDDLEESNTEVQWSTLIGLLQRDGIAGQPSDNDGKVSAGSGLTISVASIAASIVGGFVLQSTDAEPLTLDAADAQPRIDRVVARIDAEENSASLAILKGSPAASNPAVPALTKIPGGVWEIPLAQIAVATGMVNVTSGVITDEREFLGLQLGYWTTANRPLTPRKGMLGLNYTTSKWEWFDGSTWVDLSPTSINASILTGTIDEARLPVVSIAKGGTGSSSAANARTALGITPANIGAAPSAHTHNDLYYTESEINAFLAGKSDSGHTHDSRYYTESEVDALLGGKASTSHTHSSLTSGGSTWSYSSGKWRSSQGIYTSDSIETDQYLRGGAAWGYNIGGTRRAVWMDSTGTFGHTDSTAKAKSGITPVDGSAPDGAIVLTREQLRLLRVVSYRRVTELEREKSEPGYRAPTEIGVVAEQLHDAGMWPFVMYEGRGAEAVPIGVHYEILALASLQLAQFVADDVDELRRELEDIRTQLGGAR